MAGRSTKRLEVLGLILAAGIVFYVLFQVPQPGVADQGDFDRVMAVSGLQLADEDLNNSGFNRFLDYITTCYTISDASRGMLIIRLKESSITYLITLISLICQGFGQGVFRTGYLAAAYAIMYLLAMYLTMVFLNIEDKTKLVLFMAIALLILLDGNYLVWFNSLYGEPMMITTFSLYVAAWVCQINHEGGLKTENRPFARIVFVYAAAFLFLGSKLQVFSALPVVLPMLALLLVRNRHLLKPYQVGSLSFLLFLMVAYPVNLNLADRESGRDRQYNAVFYGILKDSNCPRQDLTDMGLNTDLAVDAGKHAFLSRDEYARYIPHEQITQDEFYSKMSNGKLMAFYLTHPERFAQGMQYTAGQALTTSTFLGKYQKKDREMPESEFNRFTLWSHFREYYLPKDLSFLSAIYIVVLAVSMITYLQNRGIGRVRARIRLLWGVMLVGLFQFPMPYIGNGAADTYKQLFLFNFVFDLITLVSICWLLAGLVKYCRSISGFVAARAARCLSQTAIQE